MFKFGFSVSLIVEILPSIVPQLFVSIDDIELCVGGSAYDTGSVVG